MESTGQAGWTREKIFEALRQLLIDALGVKAEEVRPEASVVNDLGAESIDFLDIGFQIKQAFGVDLPMPAVQDAILSWRNLDDVKTLLEARYGVTLKSEEIKGFRSMGLPAVLQNLAQRHGAKVGDGDAVQIAEALARKLIDRIEAGGMELAASNGQVIANLMLQHLTSSKITETLLQALTVEALTNFIGARMGVQPAPSLNQ
ncbi:MAG: acyl carrier protein [Candidatus Methylomirabilia bacterium]